MLHIINCDQCGREYATHLNTTKFCGAKCRVRAYRKRLRTFVRNESAQKSVTEIRSEKESAMPVKKCVPGFGVAKNIKPPHRPKSGFNASNDENACRCDRCWHYYRVVGIRRNTELCCIYSNALTTTSIDFKGNGVIPLKPIAEKLHSKGFDCSQWYSDMLLPHCESDALKKTPFIRLKDWNDPE